MQAFDVAEILRGFAPGGHTYLDLIASDLLSVGLARWAAGSIDDQAPHAEDEVYHVVAGSARIRVGEEDRAVGPGSVVYVAAGVAHRFHDITADLEVLVFWAPPHGSGHRSPT